ncbi:type II toxin-antitoxin system RelE/ParE family toxin [Cloacibacillus porcorum]|uniref:type II toxin-antitoxin system RelE/ParE family toxin n=1 Tax=Cloacibacillus porcorum TaxID=1197717 RepID=UPI002671E49F|nr:type II toxin-antitoxin system RelE/ParE family toxin [Cloacibacillus porcorum]
MNSFEVRFLEAALTDLEEIIIYIAAESRDASKGLRSLIIKRANELSAFPYRGTRVPDEKIAAMGFRCVPVGKYLIFYKVEEATVFIHRVLDSRRNYPGIFS